MEPAVLMIRKSLGERFWEKVDRTDTCWLWKGGRRNHGYGGFTISQHKYQAHRVAYELLVGPIPDGLTLDHLCRVRLCVNPDHLEPVTNKENVRRGLWKILCKRGHPLSEARHSINKNGNVVRVCRHCAKERGISDMPGSPAFKVYFLQEYRAACKRATDAAALCAVLGPGASVRFNHRKTVWREGYEVVSATESYDGAAAVMHDRVRQVT